MKRNRLYILPLLIAALGLGFAQTSFAAATPAGTVISNQASVSYEVSGLPKTENSSSTDFTVDSKIDLTVVNQYLTVSVLPATGATEPHAPMRFLVTNTGNEIVDMTFLVDTFADGSAFNGETDSDGNTTSYQVFVDNEGDRTTYNATDDSATTVTDLAYDDGGSTYNAVLWVIPNFDNAADDSYNAVIALQATVTAYNAANTAPSTTGSPGEDVKDSVMNDAAGDAAGDGAGDAKHSDFGVFVASVGSVTTTKSISTPPTFYIPGETVGYTLSLTNSWGVNATNVVITDDIDDQVAFVCASPTQTAGLAEGFTMAYDTSADADGLFNNVCTPAGINNSDATVQAFQISITNGIGTGLTKTFTFVVEIE